MGSWRRRSRRLAPTAVAMALSAGAATALAATWTHEPEKTGGQVSAVTVRTESGNIGRSQVSGWRTFGGVQVTVPSGRTAFLLVRVSASSQCGGLLDAICQVRVRVGPMSDLTTSSVLAPGARVFDTTFKVDANVFEAISDALPAGTYLVRAQSYTDGAPLILEGGYTLVVEQIEAT